MCVCVITSDSWAEGGGGGGGGGGEEGGRPGEALTDHGGRQHARECGTCRACSPKEEMVQDIVSHLTGEVGREMGGAWHVRCMC